MFNPTNSINQIENQIEMEAKFLKSNENVNDTQVIVMNKTMFLDESNKKLYIKAKEGR